MNVRGICLACTTEHLTRIVLNLHFYLYCHPASYYISWLIAFPIIILQLLQHWFVLRWSVPLLGTFSDQHSSNVVAAHNSDSMMLLDPFYPELVLFASRTRQP